jgi:two-component system sensor histidine kinase BarA
MKISIDLVDGAKVLGRDEKAAEEILKELLLTLPDTRRDLEQAYRERNFPKLQHTVHKFYGGLCYVGVPALRLAAKELLRALVRQEHHMVEVLYQRMIDELSALERAAALAGYHW